MKFFACSILSLFLLLNGSATSELAGQEKKGQKSLEHGPGLHDTIHCLVGGTMCSARSSNDPVFFAERTVLEWLLPPLKGYRAVADATGNVVDNSADPIQVMGFFAQGLHNNGAFRANIDSLVLIDPLDKSSPKIAHGMYRDRGKSSPKIAH
jgi:hypothetical protein